MAKRLAVAGLSGGVFVRVDGNAQASIHRLSVQLPRMTARAVKRASEEQRTALVRELTGGSLQTRSGKLLRAWPEKAKIKVRKDGAGSIFLSRRRKSAQHVGIHEFGATVEAEDSAYLQIHGSGFSARVKRVVIPARRYATKAVEKSNPLVIRGMEKEIQKALDRLDKLPSVPVKP